MPTWNDLGLSSIGTHTLQSIIDGVTFTVCSRRKGEKRTGKLRVLVFIKYNGDTLETREFESLADAKQYAFDFELIDWKEDQIRQSERAILDLADSMTSKVERIAWLKSIDY